MWSEGIRVAATALLLAACNFPSLPSFAGDGGRDSQHDQADARHDGQSVDAPAPLLSCVGLPMTCGAASNDSCCDSPEVPGGMYDRSYDVAADGMFSSTAFPATVSDFRLDKYEVTVGRFRAFVTAGMGTQVNPPPTGAGARTLNGSANQGGWDSSWNTSLATQTSTLMADLECAATYQTWTNTAGANEQLPINCVTWYEAMAFCIWDGGFLPTESEWNYAAAGGSDQRAYPWSNPPSSIAIDCTHANFGGSNWPPTACVAAGASNVGSTPSGDGKFGQSDLAGNVDELTLDWFASPYSIVPCAGCAQLVQGAATERIARGGDFGAGVANLRTAIRFPGNDPSGRADGIGVRCARAP
jgi:formylglycine-generating enzyme